MDWLQGMMNPPPEDGATVEETGAFSRFGAAMCCCLASPFFMIGCVILLGYNEKGDVCRSKAIAKGLEVVENIGCTDASKSVDKLVMLSCDIKKDGLNPLSPGGDFSNFSLVATGLGTESSMLQCLEKKACQTKKNKVGGGKTTTCTYTYSKQWASTWKDSNTFQGKDGCLRCTTPECANCNKRLDACGSSEPNPSWPSTAPTTGKKYAPKITVGVVETSHASGVPLSKDAFADKEAPSSWTKVGSTFRQGSGSNIGDLQVTFKSNDWGNTMATLLGKNDNGEVKAWTAPSDWLCKGFSLDDFRMGKKSKEELFKALKEESSALTWVLRLLCFGLLWFAWSRLFGPLEVVADCIPFIGPCLGDMVQAVVCCISCLPATCCCMFVVAITWVALRPMIGIPLFLGCIAIAVGLGALKYYADQKKKEKEATFEGGAQPETMGNQANTYNGPPGTSRDQADNFLQAAGGEYVHGQEGAVGAFFDTLPENLREAFTPYEEQIRGSQDQAMTIQELDRAWGLKATE